MNTALARGISQACEDARVLGDLAPIRRVIEALNERGHNLAVSHDHAMLQIGILGFTCHHGVSVCSYCLRCIEEHEQKGRFMTSEMRRLFLFYHPDGTQERVLGGVTCEKSPHRHLPAGRKHEDWYTFDATAATRETQKGVSEHQIHTTKNMSVGEAVRRLNELYREEEPGCRHEWYTVDAFLGAIWPLIEAVSRIMDTPVPPP